MKGIVFTEFLEMVADKFSADTVDTIIEEADPPSGGAYTAVGTYDFAEMASLVTKVLPALQPLPKKSAKSSR